MNLSDEEFNNWGGFSNALSDYSDYDDKCDDSNNDNKLAHDTNPVAPFANPP